MHQIPPSVVIDARAKIIWGDRPEKVLSFLQAKGVGDKDALALLEELVKERAASIREEGIKKTWVGALFVLAPVAYYYATLFIGYWSIKFFAALIVLGAIGVAKIMNGLSMALRPRAVKGDLANAEN
jgi:hypothetical protein